MGLRIQTPIAVSTDERREFVTVRDPSVEEANTPAALRLYLAEHDIDGLVVPADAAVFTCRPLTPTELRRARMAAGREPRRAIDAFVDLARAEEGGFLAAIDGLDDDQYAAYVDHQRWQVRLALEAIKIGVVEVRGVEDLDDGATGVDLAALMTSEVTVDDVVDVDCAGAEIAIELYQHVHAIGELGDRGKEPSSTQSGEANTPPRGTADSATIESCGPAEDDAAARFKAG